MSEFGDRMESMLRPDIAALDPYVPIQPFDVLSRRLGLDPSQIVKLDANENPYGPAPAVIEALSAYPYYHIYPDPEQTELRTELGRFLGVPAEAVLVTHGADEMLDYLCRLFIERQDVVVNCPPTFGMYRFDARINGAVVADVWRCDDFSADVAAITQVVTEGASVPAPGSGQDRAGSGSGCVKLVFLTSPNNPTGNWLSDDDLRQLLALPAMIVLDEAYVEFSGRDSRVSWVNAHDNLIVVRTFSKVAGIAGLRLGYSVCPAWLMPHLLKFKQPYNVSVAATVAGLASLRSRHEIERTAVLIRAERDRLYGELSTVSFLKPWPSEANFVLCKVSGRSAYDVKTGLERQGVMVRHYSSPGLEDCIRVSVGRPEHTDRLMRALQRIA